MDTSAVSKPFPVHRYIHFDDFRYYYAYGSMRPENYLQNAHQLKEPNILLLGCGDLRSCFYTLWKNFRKGVTKEFDGVHFVLNDVSAAVIARDVLFLHLCLNIPKEILALKKWVSAMWAIWYSHELLLEHQQLLDDAVGKLILLSKSTTTWSSSTNPLHKLVKFSSCDTLKEVRRMWRMWHKREVNVKSVWHMYQDRRSEFRQKVSDRDGVIMGVIAASMCSTLLRDATITDEMQEIMKCEVAKYMDTGTCFAEDVLYEAPASERRETTLNLTFYERKDGAYTMHFGLVPFKCFFHTVKFSKQELIALGLSKSTVEHLLVKDSHFDSLPFLSNSVQQFSIWLVSSADVLKRASSSSALAHITFTFHCSDAVDFCVQLQTPTLGKRFDCPTCFDLVYSSNLMDHLALPNLVLSALPVMKPGCVLFTTSMMYKDIAESAEKYINVLFGVDIKLLPILFGVRCINHEGDPYSSTVSVQPESYEYGHVVATKHWKKVFVWEKLSCLPLKHPSLLDKYDTIAKNLRAAVCNATAPLLLNNKGHSTMNHLCVETAMRILHCFASRVEGDVSTHIFWKPLSLLLIKSPEIHPYIHCLQTQALLHGIHLHLTVDEGNCPLCLGTPLTDHLSQVSVTVGISPDAVTPSFLIYIHPKPELVEDATNLRVSTVNKSVHIIDSLNGTKDGYDLTVNFFVPLHFIHENYYFSLVSYVLGQVLETEVDFPTILLTAERLVDYSVSSLTYTFHGSPALDPAPVTQLGKLTIHVGDGDSFETVIEVNEAVVSYFSSLSPRRESPVEVHILIQSYRYVIVYPYPVDYDRLSIKLSRKQKTITILASRTTYSFECEKPFYIFNTSDEFSKLNVPMNDDGILTYSGMQFTEKERHIMQDSVVDSPLSSLIKVKQSLTFLFQYDKEHFFNIAVQDHSVYALIYVQQKMFDLQHRSPAVDLAYCFLDLSIVALVALRWQSLAPLDATRCISLTKSELEVMKTVLSYYARRTVGPSLSKAEGVFHTLKYHRMDQFFTRAVVYPLYADPDSYYNDIVTTKEVTKSASKGGSQTQKETSNKKFKTKSDTKSFTKTVKKNPPENLTVKKNPPEKLVKTMKERSPEIAKEESAETTTKKKPRRRCANCGEKASVMKKCADCGTVKYCSRECQKQHWKVHKVNCKMSTSTSKHQHDSTRKRYKSKCSSTSLATDVCCSVCGKSSSNLKKCGACNQTWYCSEDCQRKDWNEHKKVCKMLSTSNQDSARTQFSLTKCGGCEKDFSSLRPCPCHKIAYCSTSCQRMDWGRHKTDCTLAKKQ